MSNYTDNERVGVNGIVQRLREARDFLSSQVLDEDLLSEQNLGCLFGLLTHLKKIQGNNSNDISLAACILAKRYLADRFNIGNFDVAAKPQGAPGLDIDLQTQDKDRQRIIGEIKTTVPYSGAKNDLGANQKDSFNNDFKKLNKTAADHKFFFVTDQQTYEIVRQRYADKLQGVTIVLL